MSTVRKDDLILFGPPGTGKTHAGVAWVDEQVKAGADPSGVAYVSFTNSACNEARTRVVDKLNESGLQLFPEELEYCATIHALCKRALRITEPNWLATKKLRDFADQYDYELYRAVRVDSEDVDEVMKKGGRDSILLTLWDWARSRMVFEPDAAYDAYCVYDPTAAFAVEYDKFCRFVDDYESWKQMSFKRDFYDLLREVVEKRISIPVSVAVIDEAQDQTPLLWAAADTLFKHAEKRASLGDADQSIYSFQGCAPELLYERSAEKRVALNHSHRLPRNIWKLATSIIRQNGRRQDVPFLPCDAHDIERRPGRTPSAATQEELEGYVGRVDTLDQLPLSNGESWMILVRNWMFVEEIAAQLESFGIRYRISDDDYYTPWQEKGPFKAASAMLRLSEPGGEIRLADLEPLVNKTHAQSSARAGAWQYGHKTKIEKLIEAEPGRSVSLLDLPDLGLTEWGFDRIALRDLDMLAGISQRDRDAYTASIRAGTWNDAPRVLVSTIHGVKGGEADNVVALEACSVAPLRNLEDADRREEEVRLAYVAVTRARKRFFVLSIQSKGHPYEVFGI
jgi:superfamily I DNA/RNA helicase